MEFPLVTFMLPTIMTKAAILYLIHSTGTIKKVQIQEERLEY